MASTIKEIKNPWIRTLAEYGLITVSIWIMVIGIYFFKFPNHFAFGGVTGFSTVFSQLLHCSASTFTTVANYALLVLGFIFLGKSVGIRTVYATIVMSVSLQALDALVPMHGTLTDQPMLELVFAIMLPAVGSAMLFNIGASSGGTDVIAMILKKYTSMNIGSALMAADVAAVGLSFAMYGPSTGLFSIMGLVAKSMDVFYKRSSVSAFRIAALMQVLYKVEGKKSEKEIRKLVRQTYLACADRILQNMLQRWGKAFEQISAEGEGEPYHTVDYFSELPQEFSYQFLEEFLKQKELKTPARNMVCNWRRWGWLEKPAKGEDRKVLRKTQQKGTIGDGNTKKDN